MKTIRVFALALCALAACAAHARTAEEIHKSGKIVIATEGAFSPFNFFQGSKLTGFEVDIADAIASRMGVKPEWKAISFDALLAGLQQDRWDMVIASHGITQERAKAVTFADPHYCSGGVVVAKDASLRGAKDLKGKTVAVQTGTTYLEQVKKIPGVKEVKNYPQDADARAALATGRVDAWVTDKFTAKQALDANAASGMKMGDFIFVERIAAAVKKDNKPLAADIDKALASIMADGTYASISKKWFHEDIRCR